MRLTRKYREAQWQLGRLEIKSSDNQELDYATLNEQGYYWNPRVGKWILEPKARFKRLGKNIIEIVVRAENSIVQNIADEIIDNISSSDSFEFVQRSSTYPYYKSEGTESMVYLTFEICEQDDQYN